MFSGPCESHERFGLVALALLLPPLPPPGFLLRPR